MIKEKLFFGFTILSIGLMIIFSHNQFLINNKTLTNVSFNKIEQNFLTPMLVDKLLKQKIGVNANQSNLKLDLKNIEDFLETLPEVHNAEVFYNTDNIINVEVYETSALLRIQSEAFYLDPFGVKIPFSRNFTPQVPLYSGTFHDNIVDELVNLSKFILVDPYLKSELVEIWNENNGYSLRLRNHNFDIFWGKVKNNEEKKEKLKAFCAYAIDNKSKIKSKKIDLTILDQVISIN